MYQRYETNGPSLDMLTGLHLEIQNVSKNKIKNY